MKRSKGGDIMGGGGNEAEIEIEWFWEEVDRRCRQARIDGGVLVLDLAPHEIFLRSDATKGRQGQGPLCSEFLEILF